MWTSLVIGAVPLASANGNAVTGQLIVIIIGACVLVAAVAGALAFVAQRRRARGGVEEEPIDIRSLHDVLVSRQPKFELDLHLVNEHIAGERILVTGAAGAIGSELCRQLVKCAPAELVAIDLAPLADHVLAELRQRARGKVAVEAVVADVRVASEVDAVFAEKRPTVVIHCASLEDPEFIEADPVKGWQTNVLGANTVLRSAAT